MDSARILIVEDDHDIAHLIALHLREVGFGLEVVHDGLDGLERASSGNFDLIVLDLLLPRLSGTELCQRLRAANNYTLILMLTARSSVDMCQSSHQILEHAQTPPELKTLMENTGADPEPASMNCFPLAACPQNVPDSVKHSSVLHPRAASTSPTLLPFGELLLDLTP